MPDPAENVEFEAIAVPTSASSRAKEESEQLESGLVAPPPNSVTLNFGKYCQVRWHADSSAPLFCFVSIVVLLVFGLLIAVIAITNSQAGWPDEVFKFVGQAILTLVGAVVGASATTSSSRTRRSGSR